MQVDEASVTNLGESMLSESNGVQFCRKSDFLVNVLGVPAIAQDILAVSDTSVYNI